MNARDEQSIEQGAGLSEPARRALAVAKTLADQKPDVLAQMETGQYVYKEGFVPGLHVELSDEARSGAAVLLNVLQGRAPFTPFKLPSGGIFTPQPFELPAQD